ncbi:MAG: alpha/beta hydrolase [Rubrivivax sp.]|nr:alpha/beta hydrolase [Rubrivivax sp.]
MRTRSVGVAVLAAMVTMAWAQAPTPQGEVKGDAWVHTPESLRTSAELAAVVLPARVTGGAPYTGKLKDAPAGNGQRVAVVLFLHGSSGLGLKAIGEWQQWLATMGIASVAPDSFTLPGHVTYKSPIDKASYERIHALRASEIRPALEAIRRQPWADPARLILAGTSEGAVPVARHEGREFAARMLYAWSCEPNYFVEAPRNAFEADKPVLNVISSTDPFFSRSNAWLGNADAQGHCGAALKDNPRAAVVLVPGAPQTLLNLPAARHATAGFLAPYAAP